MPSYLAALLAVIALVTAWAPRAAAAEPTGHRIEVRIDGLDVPEVKLAYYYGKKQYITEEHAKVQDGRVVFEGDKPLAPGVYMLVIPPSFEFFEFLVDDDQHFTLRSKRDHLVPSMDVRGSTLNQVFYEDIKRLAVKRAESEAIVAKRDALPEGHAEREALQGELRAIDAEVRSSREALVAQHPGSMYVAMLQAMREPSPPEGTPQERYEYVRTHFFDDVDFSDARLLRTPILENKVDYYLDKLTYQTPEHQIEAVDELLARVEAEPEIFKFFAIKLLNRYAKSKVVCMDAAYVHVSDRVYKSGKAVWSDTETSRKILDNAERLRPILCGTVAPNVTVQDAEGRDVQVHGIDADVTVLYVWSTRCSHCRTEGPKVRDQLRGLKSERVALLTIETSLENEWTAHLERAGLLEGGDKWVHTRIRDTSFHRAYDVRTVPQIFVLDRDKRIVSKRIGGDDLGKILTFHLDKQP